MHNDAQSYNARNRREERRLWGRGKNKKEEEEEEEGMNKEKQDVWERKFWRRKKNSYIGIGEENYIHKVNKSSMQCECSSENSWECKLHV